MSLQTATNLPELPAAYRNGFSMTPTVPTVEGYGIGAYGAPPMAGVERTLTITITHPTAMFARGQAARAVERFHAELCQDPGLRSFRIVLPPNQGMGYQVSGKVNPLEGASFNS